MIAVDTNILVYAHRQDSPFHEAARNRVTAPAQGRAPWAIPWPCIHEFWSVVTNPRVFKQPSTQAEARRQIDAWMASPSLVLLHETPMHWPTLQRLMDTCAVIGAQIHDARIAALCVQSDVRELWSADRDFKRFLSMKVRNPLAV